MPKRNLAWILVVAMIALLMWQLPQTIAGRDSVYKAFGPLVDVRAQIHRRFVGDVDDEKLVDSAVKAGIRAMVKTLHDPHAVYLDEGEYDEFQKRTEGTFGGIGVELWSTPIGMEILSREPNSPAARANLIPGDLIVAIDDRATGEMPLVEAVNLLNGPPGTEVELKVVTPNEAGASSPRKMQLKRAVIQLNAIRGWSRSPTGKWRYLMDAEDRLAYVRITKFTPGVDQELDAVMNELLALEIRGLVLDLRENPGGLLKSAIEVSDRFLESGLIVRVSGRKSDEKQSFASRSGTYPEMQLVVLINGSTASAAEIVAGAIRDHQRGLVIGERSYGKGSVQEVVELDHQGGALKLTTAYYFLPGGQCVHRTPQAVKEGTWGVQPSIPVNLSDRQREQWRAAWREIGREIVPPGATQPAPTTGATCVAPGRKAALAALMDADLQLSKGLESLRRGIGKKQPSGAGSSGEAKTSGVVVE